MVAAMTPPCERDCIRLCERDAAASTAPVRCDGSRPAQQIVEEIPNVPLRAGERNPEGLGDRRGDVGGPSLRTTARQITRPGSLNA
jgi:hypothetical protein